MEAKSMKMKVKKTTAAQFALLLGEIEKKQEVLKHTPALYYLRQKFWENITEKLNVIGPPKRSVQEWKKVFFNLKVNTKKKMAEMEEVGFLHSTLSEFEERLSKILKKPSGETFRVPSKKSYPPFTSNSIFLSPISDITVKPPEDASTPVTHFTTGAEKRKADDQSNSLFRCQLQHQVKYMDLSKEIIEIMDRQSICLHKLANTVERQEVIMQRQLELLEKQTLTFERQTAVFEGMDD